MYWLQTVRPFPANRVRGQVGTVIGESAAVRAAAAPRWEPCPGRRLPGWLGRGAAVVPAQRSEGRGDSDTTARLAAWEVTREDLEAHPDMVWDLTIDTTTAWSPPGSLPSCLPSGRRWRRRERGLRLGKFVQGVGERELAVVLDVVPVPAWGRPRGASPVAGQRPLACRRFPPAQGPSVRHAPPSSRCTRAPRGTRRCVARRC